MIVDFITSLNNPDYEVIGQHGHNRANAMNIAAKSANHDYFWFLHADSIIDETHLHALQEGIKNSPNALHFFDLKFHSDGPILSCLNAMGANIRSRLFQIPWGDQGFCLSQNSFNYLGGYNEKTTYGEDHLLVWAAHQKRLPLNRIRKKLYTSARQYRKSGWLRLTLKRQYLWIKQAAPELVKLIKIRLLK